MLSNKLRDKIVAPRSYTSQIAIKECHENLVSARGVVMEDPFWLDKTNLVNEVEGRFYTEYIHEHTDFKLLVRRGVLDRLLLAQQKLPKQWRMMLRAGYRPFRVQEAMFVDYLQKVQREHLEWSVEVSTAYCERYISNPYKVASPHVTGGAIDIDIYDTRQEQSVDMGSKICELSSKAHCLNSGLTVAQRKNQEILLTIMCGVGFAPFQTEWWHFSYGDQKWASFYSKSHAMYGNI